MHYYQKGDCGTGEPHVTLDPAMSAMQVELVCGAVTLLCVTSKTTGITRRTLLDAVRALNETIEQLCCWCRFFLLTSM